MKKTLFNILIFIGLLLLAIINAHFFDYLNESFFHQNLRAKQQNIPEGVHAILAILFIPFIETGICQSLLYFVVTNIFKIEKKIFCILIMSVIFSLFHWYGWLYIVAIFGGGIILNLYYVLMYHRVNSTYTFFLTVLFHMSYNSYAVIINYYT